MNITVTESAREYLSNLLSKNSEAIGVRLFVDKPGTPRAETLLTYAKESTVKETDVKESFGPLDVYAVVDSVKYLEDALINYDEDFAGGTLTIKAPNSKLPQVGPDATLSDKVNYVLYNDVNEMVKMHGGEVSLVEITDEDVAIISFGGGCQGCSAVDATLKHVVEDTIMKAVPEIKGVKDITDHTDTSNAYYR